MTDSVSSDYIGLFTVERPVSFADAALVVIDMQYATGSRQGALGRRLAAIGSDAADYRFERIETLVLPNVKRLLAAFRGAGGRVVYITIGATLPDAADAPPHMRKLFQETGNIAGRPDHEIIDEVRPQPGEPVVNKTANGAFSASAIDPVLRALGAGQLYLCGVSTNMCVDTTGREAADRGYAVTLISDACAAARPEYHEFALNNFQRLFGRVRTVDQVLAELGLA